MTMDRIPHSLQITTWTQQSDAHDHPQEMSHIQTEGLKAIRHATTSPIDVAQTTHPFTTLHLKEVDLT